MKICRWGNEKRKDKKNMQIGKLKKKRLRGENEVKRKRDDL